MSGSSELLSSALSPGYHHSLPSTPYNSTAGRDAQRSAPSGTFSSEYLNQGGSSKVLLLVCNTAGCGQQAVRLAWNEVDLPSHLCVSFSHPVCSAKPRLQDPVWRLYDCTVVSYPAH